MAHLYRRKRSPNWWMEWRVGGRRFRKSTGTSRRELAEGVLAKLIRQQLLHHAGAGAAPVPTTEFIKAVERKLTASGSSPRSVRQTAAHLTRFFEAVGKPPSLVEPDDVQAYLELRAGHVSQATVRRELDSIFAAFRAALRRGELLRDPCASIKKPSLERKLITCLRAEEVGQLLAAAREWRDGAVLVGVALAAYAGLRLAEVRHTDWPDVDLEARRLYVRGKDGWRPKTRQERVLPISDALAVALGDHRRESGPLLSAPSGTRRGKTYMTKAMLALRKASEVEQAGWQILRHTFASQLVGQGVSIYKVSKLLGHGSVQTTERHYAHLAPDELGQDVNRLGY